MNKELQMDEALKEHGDKKMHPNRCCEMCHGAVQRTQSPTRMVGGRVQRSARCSGNLDDSNSLVSLSQAAVVDQDSV